MRQATCVFVAVIAFALTARPAAGQVNWGVIGGVTVNSVTVTGADAFEADARTGAAVGLSVDAATVRPLALHAELLLAWPRFASSNVPVPFTVSSRSIEVPVLARVRVASTPRARVWLEGGPQLAFIRSVTQRSAVAETDVSDLIKDVDAAAVFGGAIGWDAARGALVLDVRVAIGARNLAETAGRDLKSRAFTALVGFRF